MSSTNVQIKIEILTAAAESLKKDRIWITSALRDVYGKAIAADDATTAKYSKSLIKSVTKSLNGNYTVCGWLYDAPECGFKHYWKNRSDPCNLSQIVKYQIRWIDSMASSLLANGTIYEKKYTSKQPS